MGAGGGGAGAGAPETERESLLRGMKEEAAGEGDEGERRLGEQGTGQAVLREGRGERQKGWEEAPRGEDCWGAGKWECGKGGRGSA